jgi:hypothetical protein
MNVLIVGNGFDLDLGLHTSYKDFAKSPYWDELYKPDNKWNNNGLADFINHQSLESAWFDIEECLAVYVKRKEKERDFSLVQQDKLFLKALERQLTQYLSDQLLSPKLNGASLANKIIKVQEEAHLFDSIYSFNYTEYDYFGAIDVDMGYLYDVVPLHSMKGDIILGIEEEACESREYSFVRKVCHPSYPSTRIVPDLLSSTIVVVFGHSLNSFDYKYFKQYFISLRQDILKGKERSVYIISKDDNSINTIKDNLCEHNMSLTELSSAVKFISTERYENKCREDVEEVDNMITKLIRQ